MVYNVNSTTNLSGEKSIYNSTETNVGGKTTLNNSGNLSVSNTSFIVTDGSLYTAGQTIKIDNEFIIIGSIDSNTFNNCTRGSFGSSASSHSDGSDIIGVFVGKTDTNQIPDVMISIKSDTTGYLYFDMSDDRNNWDTFPINGYLINSNEHKFYSITKGQRFFRARFENNDPSGSSIQTTNFRMYTYYGYFNEDSFRNGVSNQNSFSETLTASQNRLGIWEDVSRFSSITIMGYISNSQNATLYAQFSIDASTVTKTIQLSTGTDTNIGNHCLTTMARFFRVRIVDSGGSSAINIQTIYHTESKISLPSSTINDTLTNYSNVLNTKSVINAPDSANNYNSILRNENRAMYVSINEPIGPFNTLLVGDLNSVIQRKFVSGTNSKIDNIITKGNATITASSGILECSSSTTSSSLAQYKSKKICNYLPGQGIIIRFSTLFGTPAASTTSIIGLGTPSNGVFIGYNGTSFGLLRRTNGIQDVRKLEITLPADGTGGDFTITLNGQTSTNITVDPNSSIGEIVKTIYDSGIFNNIGGGWDLKLFGDSIYFIAIDTDTRNGSYSFNDIDSGVTATFSQILSPTQATDNWVYQSNWNSDRADNTGILPTIDFTKGNVFQIQYQWLGYGLITLMIENPSDGKFITCHRILYVNTSLYPTIKNPDLPFMIECNNKSTTNDIKINTGSLGVFIVGNLRNTNIVESSISHSFSSSTTIILALRFNPIRNSDISYNSCVITSLTFGNESTNKIATFNIIKNCGLVGSVVNWSDINNLPISFNTEATNNIGGEVIYTNLIGPGEGKTRELNNTSFIIIYPGDILVIKGNISNSAILDVGISFYINL